MSMYYKAVRLDRTSHHDRATKWRAGRWVYPDYADETHTEPCGHGIHCSPTLLDAVGNQNGPSLYLEVEPDRILGEDSTKARCNRVKAIRWLNQREVDRLAGFRLWEANHPHDPRHAPALRIKRCLQRRLSAWTSVWSSVRGNLSSKNIGNLRTSVTTSVRASVWGLVGASVWADAWDSIRDSVEDSASAGASARARLNDSILAYIGSLLPDITRRRGTNRPDPWAELRALWYDGYVPILIDDTWKLWTVNGLVEGVEA